LQGSLSAIHFTLLPKLKINWISTTLARGQLAVENNLFSRKACKKPLSKKNRKARLEFAIEHINWTVTDRSKILWSDESKFNLFGNDSRSNVRPIGQRFNVKYLKLTVKFGGGNVMVWAHQTQIYNYYVTKI